MNNNLEDRRLFNIDILLLRPEILRTMREVKKPHIFEPNSSVFDRDGLFSTDIFGPIGSETRNNQFGYIDLSINILHPLVFMNLVSMRSLYGEIVTGKVYASFDNSINDFVPTSKDDGGNTGYDFFFKNMDKIVFKDNGSDQRKFKIDFIKKYMSEPYYVNKWLVLPAGLRDYTLDKNDRPTEDEVNDLYRELLNVSNMLKNTKLTPENQHLMDPTRYRLQNITVKIYEHYKSLMDGKNKFMLGKVAKRSVSYGTRNVITPSLTKIVDLDDPNRIRANDTIIGLYQYAKAISPITMHHVQTKFVNKILNPDSNQAYLINPKTMKTELVEIKINKRDEWLSQEGLDGILNKLGQEDIRTEPIKIDGYYMCLLYDKDDTIEVVFDTNNLPEYMDPKYLRPITYSEMVYISVYETRNLYPAFLTRYPVAGLGGIYPCKSYLKTTTIGRTVKFKSPGMLEYNRMVEYPILGNEYVSSLSPNTKNVARLVADSSKFN